MRQADEHDGRYQLPLYVTEGEIIRRMGVGIHSGRKALQKMRLHPKFPPQTIGAKRYWPSVVDFLDFWNGRSAAVCEDPQMLDVHHGRPRPSLEAARAWLKERGSNRKSP
jgi:hypothetical protein